jgi:hypothetical protein
MADGDQGRLETATQMRKLCLARMSGGPTEEAGDRRRNGSVMESGRRTGEVRVTGTATIGAAGRTTRSTGPGARCRVRSEQQPLDSRAGPLAGARPGFGQQWLVPAAMIPPNRHTNSE